MPSLRWLGVLVASVVSMAGTTAATTAPAAAAPVGWSIVASPPNFTFGDSIFHDLSCPSPSVCYGVGYTNTGTIPAFKDAFVKTTDGWATSTVGAVRNGFTQLLNVDCPTTLFCIALAASAYVYWTTSDGGTTWISHPYPSNVGEAEDVACGSATHCELVGQKRDTNGENTNQPFIDGTTNGGLTWKQQSPPLFVQNVAPIACPSATVCEMGGDFNVLGVGADAALLRTTNGGGHWTARTIPNTYDVEAIACPTTTLCTASGLTSFRSAGGPSVYAVRTTGSGPLTMDPPPLGGGLGSISCASVSFCEWVSGFGAVGSTDGSTWAAQSLPAGFGYLDTVACPSADSCFASGHTASQAQVLQYTP